MPDFKFRDNQTGETFTMPWEGKDPPSESDIEYYKYQKANPPAPKLLDKVGEVAGKAWSGAKGAFNSEPVQRLIHGPSAEETQNNYRDFTGNQNATPPKVLTGQEGSVLPEWKSQPETFMGGAAKSLYNDFVRPLGNPLSIVQGSGPGSMIGKGGLPSPPKPELNIPEPAQLPPSPERLGLPPAPDHIANPARFINGPAGTTEAGKSYPLDMGQRPELFSGTLSNQEFGSVTQMPAPDAARLGTKLGTGSVLDATPESIASAKDTLNSGGAVEIPKDPNLGNVGNPGLPAQLPSANRPSLGPKQGMVPNQFKGAVSNLASPDTANELGAVSNPTVASQVYTNASRSGIKQDITPNMIRQSMSEPKTVDDFRQGQFSKYVNKPGPFSEPLNATPEPTNREGLLKDESGFIGRKPGASTTPTPERPKGNTTTPAIENDTYTSKNLNVRPIPVDASPKEAVKQWADGVAASQLRSKFAGEEFSHLSDPSLIDKYEAGSKAPELDSVRKYHDIRQKQGVELGLLKQNQSIPNYLRHEYEQAPEDVTAQVKSYLAKNPSIAKTRTHLTYAEARAADLTPKINTIPEAVSAYEAKYARAVHNKAFYDYLVKTKQLESGEFVKSPDNWVFKGPNAPELKTLVENAMSKSKGPVGAAADVSSIAKNIYMGGGAPYTKYNMHEYNIARNDMALNGYASGIGKLLSDPTGKQAAQWVRDLPGSEKSILADLSERGWQGKPMQDVGKEVNLPSKLAGEVDNKVGKGALNAAGKVLETSQHAFESPLFDRALPALNAQRTLEAYHKLAKAGMSNEEALQGAAKIGNEFYGGVDKVLRNKSNTDLGRILFLAPDWLESQVRKAVSQWKGAAKTVTGKGTALDKIYAKSLARSAVLPSAGAVVSGLVGKKLLGNKQRDIAAMPVGELKEGNGRTKTREIPTLTTANEEWRLPIAAPVEMLRGNPAALKDILLKNRISTTASTVWDLVNGQDRFGNPLAGKDKYGRPIKTGTAIGNYAKEATRPFQHQAVQALVSWLKGDITAEEAASQGLELPVAYTGKPKGKPTPHEAPRLRVR